MILPLGKDLSLDSLVDDDTDSMLRHVIDAPSLAMVALVNQTLLKGSITLQIRNTFKI